MRFLRNLTPECLSFSCRGLLIENTCEAKRCVDLRGTTVLCTPRCTLCVWGANMLFLMRESMCVFQIEGCSRGCSFVREGGRLRPSFVFALQ